MVLKYLEEYLHYLKYEKNYSSLTIDSYERDIVEYISFCDEHNIDIIKQVSIHSEKLKTLDFLISQISE